MPTVLRINGFRFFFFSDAKKILSIVKEHQKELIGAWNEYFNNKA